MWTQLAFGGGGGLPVDARGRLPSEGKNFGIVTAVTYLIARCRAAGEPVDLNRIVDPDPALDRYHRVRRARITAAQAALYEAELGDLAAPRGFPHRADAASHPRRAQP